jgi:hypothetical protein
MIVLLFAKSLQRRGVGGSVHGQRVLSSHHSTVCAFTAPFKLPHIALLADVAGE